MPSVSSTPADIRIEDLTQPVLTPMQKGIREALDKLELDLTAEGILEEARQKTGLDDFGPDDFMERLEIWMQSIREDDSSNGVGKFTCRSDTLRYAMTRLRLQDFIRRHPGVDDIEIRKPIIVVGLPRSGTTHLLNLIAADQRLRSMPYWESREPVPVLGEEPGPDGVDPRITRCEKAYELQAPNLPLIKNMHDMAPHHVHEEIELQGPDFSTYAIEWIGHLPRWRDYYLAHDQRPHYAYMKRALQALQYQRGPDRWILKSPQHLEQLGPLMDTFPDATIAFTHRDPVSVITSAITMMAYSARLRCKEVDAPGIAAYWIDRVEHLLRRCVEDRQLVAADQSCDVLFHEFMADDVATVERIYELAGLPVTEDAKAQLDAYMVANPRGKHGRIRYDLQGDFGVDPQVLRDRFAFYYERFPVRVEG